MILFKKAAELRKWLDNQSSNSASIGFVPTMGALHKGHISLIAAAKTGNSLVVCSVFVNPTQFNDPKDFEKYPITIEKDIQLLEEAGCDVLFLPAVADIYPDGTKATKHYELGYLETLLEGFYRPGHYQGVCAVVDRLLDIVQPDQLYLGQKDYQQCMVIKKLLTLTGKQDDIAINVCPTLRETDGLAMSSRNMRLNADERAKAVLISEVLKFIKKHIKPGPLGDLQQRAVNMLEEEGFRVDYVSIADANDLSPVADWDGKQELVALIAAYLNEVRLIDNLIVKV